jgi:hypothetical protein
MLFLYLTESGTAALVDTEGTDESLPALQALVDGWVDVVSTAGAMSPIGFDADIWVNDEGLYRSDFGVNLLASLFTGRRLVGPAVLATSDSEGRTRGLTKAQVTRLGRRGLEIATNDGRPFTVAEILAERADA